MTALPNEKPYTTADVEALPEGRRAELISGDMYMLATPTRIHQKIVANILTRIHNHIEAEHMPCEAYPAPFAVYIGGTEDHYNYVEPDISVICDESKLTDKGCAGAPDWIIEIVSPSSMQRDYISKLSLYEHSGVHEYWIVNPDSQTVRTYLFDAGETAAYTREYSFNDSIPVSVCDGFRIRISDLI